MAIGLALGSTRVTASSEELLTGQADALGQLTAWTNGIGWVLVFAGFTGLALVFPGGSLPGGRWAVAARIVVAASASIALLLLFGPVINVTVPGVPSGIDVPNPLAAPFLDAAALPPGYTAMLWTSLFVLTVVGVVSLLDRFLGSSGLERLQYRWLAWAVVVAAVGSGVWAILANVIQVQPTVIATAFVLVSYPAIPVAVVVAVVRYRLYEIDRLVSRTLGWALATAAVVSVFVIAVLALQALLAGITQGQTLAVAASTLLASAAFQPVRARVQAAVDRRFDRPRLEAERSLVAYGERLQHEVDLVALTRDVELTVRMALRPASAGTWIRPTRATKS